MYMALLQLNRMGYCYAMKQKALIIRFSSFGDIIQSLSCINELAKDYEIDFLTKNQFAALPTLHPEVKNVISFDRKTGLLGLIKLAWGLRQVKYDLIYDAHENPRSKVVRWILSFLISTKIIVRSKDRIKRFLFFKFNQRDILPHPFKGMVSYCRPLGLNPSPQLLTFETKISKERRDYLDQFSSRICLVPSAAWDMKRWPISHWKNLIKELNSQSVILGGPDDHFCAELSSQSDFCDNLSGKLSLIESCYIVSKSKIVISGDTGLLHVADLQSVPVIALIGPTAFGYPTFETSHVLEKTMPCKPCSKDGRGNCIQSIWQKCMVDISPTEVHQKINQLID